MITGGQLSGSTNYPYIIPLDPIQPPWNPMKSPNNRAINHHTFSIHHHFFQTFSIYHLYHFRNIPTRYHDHVIARVYHKTFSGWWFGTCFIFQYMKGIICHHPNWRVFFSGVGIITHRTRGLPRGQTPRADPATINPLEKINQKLTSLLLGFIGGLYKL